ncbi:MAG: hypothetical protein EBS42_15800, partial [Caulobacteraceae bacterium]|nr:hypothetical protein [Caulobacteraceae bacterium]
MTQDSLIPESPSEDDYVRQVTEASPLPLLSEQDPFALFEAWMQDARASEPNDPNAMALATTDPDGLPDVRMVLLKGVDRGGQFDQDHASKALPWRLSCSSIASRRACWAAEIA